MNPMEKLFDRPVELMGKALSLRLKKHEHIAGNLANMNTPGYRVKDLEFQKALQKSLPKSDGRLPMEKSHAGHIPAGNLKGAYESAQNSVVYGVYGQDEQGQDVLDIDQEMTKLVKNHLMYNATVQMLSKEFENIKYAISEGGK